MGMPEWLMELIQSGVTVIALIVIIMLLAALFMIIFVLTIVLNLFLRR